MKQPRPSSLCRLAVAVIAAGGLASAGPAVAQMAARAPAAGEPSHRYVTQPSDTVIGIARRLLVDPGAWREVARFNRLTDPNRIASGAALLIPLRLMKSEAMPAQVEHVVGEVRLGEGSAAAPLRAGQMLPEGATVQTGRDGSAVLRLADGSLLRLAAGSQLQIERARRYPGGEPVDSGVKLEQGRVEVEAAKATAGKPGFEVRTPQGVLGVRGTEFRASVGAGQPPRTTGEVLEGAVQFAGSGHARQLAAGFGTVIDAARRVAEPTPLLAAPDLGAMPTLQERLVLRFPLPQLAGAVAFRGQVVRDGSTREVLADNLANGGELRFANLDDGRYVLRVRAIDGRGLEGRDASLAFQLKARPEPPLPAAPAPRGVLRGDRVELSWTGHPEAVAYRLQLAGDERFTRIVREAPALTTTSHAFDALAAGDYFWRLASVRAGNDQGPWGDVRSFVLRALPQAPTLAAPAVGAAALRFTWSGEPGQTFELQIARDLPFAQLVLERQLNRAEFDVTRLAGGTYFMRLRARDADGFQGPFTAPQRFEIIDCVTAGDGACVRTAAGAPLRRQ